ncbi:MAG TPA: RNA-binding cell elongation regulator Jag/EloR [Oceanobacillus sp.]|nr:RNA-binding cell elongation regulator Jag/EloR [Oceanobacillus sp.]
MNEENFVEVTGETVEEAIASGLAELGVGPTEVIVEVLEEPSKGVLGIGGHPARVRLELLTRKQPGAPASTPISKPIEESTPITLPQSQQQDYLDMDAEDSELTYLSESDEVPEREQDEEAAIGKVVLTELLERMSIRARVVVRRAKPGDQGESAPWILDVTGSNLNRLVGRRGETLAALQYITRLITSRELQRRAEVIVDVDGYKARRAQTLHNLALRMATEAIERGRTVSLEPMPPHERRIVHLALRGREDVVTRSVGEGASRKVTIVPKSQSS